MRPLAVLVLAEFVVLTWLTAQWLAGEPTLAKTSRPAAAPMPAVGPAAAAAPLSPPPTASNVSAREAASAGVPEVLTNDSVGIVVSGSVRSSDGKLVEDANVFVRSADEYHNSNSSAPGAYAIAGLHAGEWKLTCRAEGFAQHERTCVLDRRAFQQIDLELQPTYVVRVKVQGADGKSIVEELEKTTMWGLPYVVATEAPLTGDLPPTEQSRLIRFGLGEWSFYSGISSKPEPKLLEQGFCGELRMNRPPPAFATLLLRTTMLQGQRIEPGQQELVFTIEAKDVLAKHGSATLRLLDGVRGEPIADAHVTLRTAQGGGSHAKTGADGRAVIEQVVPGLGILELMRGPDRETLSRYVRVPAGGAVDLGDITLCAAIKITGFVIGADRKPVNGASVQWTELDSRTFPQPLIDHRSTSADAEGKFELWGCGNHRYVVFARTRDGSFGFAVADASSGAPPAVTIELGKPTSVALRAKPDPTVGYIVTALSAGRVPVVVATLASEYRPGSIALPRGSYTIEIHDMQSNRLVRSFALTVGSEPLTIDVP